MNNSAAEVEELDEGLVRRAKEKVGELFNCHVNKLSQTIVAGHLATGHKVVFKSSSSSSMGRKERGSSMGRKETRKYDEDFSNSILESFKKS